jgi:FKBP-type peptidyl-prolyl cis-trans isomerase
LPGKPVSLKMKKMIPGLSDALTRMPIGSKWEIVIPSQEAYGERGSDLIGPNETVIFEMELFDYE